MESKNISEQLKEFATFLLVVGCLASIILAIVFGKVNGNFSFWLFIAILFAGCVFSVLDYLLLSGFSILVESAEENTVRSKNIETLLSGLKKDLQSNYLRSIAHQAPLHPAESSAQQASSRPDKPPASQTTSNPISTTEPQIVKQQEIQMKRTLSDHLAYAMKFQTDDGLQNYLRKIAADKSLSFTDEEMSLLDSLLQLPRTKLREAIRP